MMLLPGHDERVFCVTYSPDGRRLASCGSDWAVRLWDLETAGELATFRAHRRNVVGVIFHIDGVRLLSLSLGDRVIAWDPETGRETMSITAATSPVPASIGPRSPGWSPSKWADAVGWRIARERPRLLSPVEDLERRERSLVAALEGDLGADESADYVPFQDGPRPMSLYVPVSEFGTRRGTFVEGLGWSLVHSQNIEACFSPDGTAVAVTRGAAVSLRRLADLRALELKGHADMVRTLAFSPDGATLATSGYDGTVRLWDTEDGSERACLDAEVGVIDSVAFSPDGMTLAAGGKRGIVIWDAGEGF